MFISHYNGHGIKLVRPLSTVDNTRDYALVSHSRQWSNYNVAYSFGKNPGFRCASQVRDSAAYLYLLFAALCVLLNE